MGTYIEPFDLKKIFLQYFIGNNLLFFYVFVIIFSYACAKYQMSNRNYFILLAISSVMLAAYLEMAIYFLIFFLIGFFTFKLMTRLLS